MTNRLPAFPAAPRRAALLATALCVASAAPAWAARDYLAIGGVKAEVYQKWIDEVSSNGFRPVYVNGYDVGGAPQFIGVAVKDPNGPAWEARHDLNSEEFERTLDALKEKGFRPISVSGYLSGKKARFAAVWVKDDKSVAWKARHGLTRKEYDEAVVRLKKEGLRPAVVSGYSDDDGKVRFTTLFVEAGDAEWDAHFDLTAEQYQKEIDRLGERKGFRPVSVSVYDTPDGPRFATVFLKDDHKWMARFGMRGDEFQKEFDKLAEEGLRPVSAVGYRDGEAVRYSAVWYRRD